MENLAFPRYFNKMQSYFSLVTEDGWWNDEQKNRVSETLFAAKGYWTEISEAFVECRIAFLHSTNASEILAFIG